MVDGNTLQHAARQRVVETLLDEGGEADIGTLVNAQVAATDATFVDAVTALHDLHVPKLESAGLVESPEGETVVELTVSPERARSILHGVE